MKLENYSDFSEKGKKFEHKIINTKKEFNELFSELNSSKNLIFRGSNEAKHKIYPTGQRAWLGYEIDKITPKITYENFILEQIANTKAFQNNLLVNFYTSFKSKPYNLTILSFLQHYGGNTPFIDFTERIKVALYFATEKIKIHPVDNIDNYFSIYVIEKNEIVEWSKEIKKFSKDFTKEHSEEIINNIFLDSPYFIKWGINKLNIKNNTYIIEVNRQNLNIINQKGLFVFNPDATKPLEEILDVPFETVINNIIDSKRDKFNLIKCFDIHKNLSEYIKSKINLSDDFIYPKEEDIAKSALLKFLKS